jgi:hypothetical protein
MKLKVRFQSRCISHFVAVLNIMIDKETQSSEKNMVTASHIICLQELKNTLMDKMRGKLVLKHWTTVSIDIPAVVIIYRCFEKYYDLIPPGNACVFREDLLNNCIKTFDQMNFFVLLKQQIEHPVM